MITNQLEPHVKMPPPGVSADCISVAQASQRCLIGAAQAGDREALEELLSKQRPALIRAARRFRMSHEDTEDVVQDALLRALTHLRSFRQESNFSTWMIAILNNSALTLKRKSKRARWHSLEHGPEETHAAGNWDVPDHRLGPEQEAMHKELVVLLHTVVLKQSRTHRVILENSLSEDRSIHELAASFGITLSSAKSSLFRAKRKVTESFVRRGLVNRHHDRRRMFMDGTDRTS